MYILSRTKETIIDDIRLEVPVGWPENQWFDFGPSRTDKFSLSILRLFDEGEDIKSIFYRKTGHHDWLFIAVADKFHVAGRIVNYTPEAGGNIVEHHVYRGGVGVHS